MYHPCQNKVDLCVNFVKNSCKRHKQYVKLDFQILKVDFGCNTLKVASLIRWIKIIFAQYFTGSEFNKKITVPNQHNRHFKDIKALGPA